MISIGNGWNLVQRVMPSRAFEKAGFTMGQDFNHIIISDNMVKRTQGGGVQLKKLMLTIDCAKSFAMMALHFP